MRLFHLFYQESQNSRKLNSAKPSFINATVSSIIQNRDTFFNASDNKNLLKNVFEFFFELVYRRNFKLILSFYNLSKKDNKQQKNFKFSVKTEKKTEYES